MPDETPVLIVGAGPTGLVLGCMLLTRGVPVRLVDALEGPVSTSRAFTIHARTLELMDQLELRDAFLSRGHETHSMDYHFPGMSETPCLDFRALDSRHRYCLTVDQVNTEALLRERFVALGGVVEWSTRLLAFEQTPDCVVARVSTAEGEESTIEARWLVGCDGIGSTVRKGLAIEFDGSEYAGTMRMVDAPLSGYTGSDSAIHYHIGKDHMLMIAKLPGPHHRVLISDRTQGVPASEARAAFQSVLDQHFSTSVTLGEPTWATNFRISKRLSDAFRRGRVFLAGDSAHVNSPAGGQGMNVAMQDAFNLGWKLGAVCKGEAPGALLESYGVERQPIAKQMLEGTNYIHSIVMAHGKGMTERIERMRGGAWNAQAVNQVAGIAYTYREPGSEASLCAGDRAPDGPLTQGQGYIYDLFPKGRLTALLFAEAQASVAELEALRQTSEALKARYRAPLHVCVSVTDPAQRGALGSLALLDEGALSQRYRGQGAGPAFVIRPDLHLAYVGPVDGLEPCLDALATRA